MTEGGKEGRGRTTEEERVRGERTGERGMKKDEEAGEEKGLKNKGRGRKR